MTVSQHWIDLAQDPDSGNETLRAHFKGHAYDPHFHDSYLVGFTEQGVQQFNCRRQRHQSTPGRLFLVEPGELHDGDAPTQEGFTYRMLYLDPRWLEGALTELAPQLQGRQPGFPAIQADDPRLVASVASAFTALHHQDLRIVRQAALDDLAQALSRHLQWRTPEPCDPRLPLVALRARDYLHAHCAQDIGLVELAAACGVDRFRLTRAFRAAFGIAPHAYLVQLRLARARRLLASGTTPSDVAAQLGFADQSHLGRWFLRAYGLSPGAYRKRCTKLPD